MASPDLDISTNMLGVGAVSGHPVQLRPTSLRHQSDRIPALVRAAHDKSAAAKNVHRHLLAEVTSACDQISGVSVIDARGLNVLNIYDKAVLRFKKMDEGGRSSSYPTPQNWRFDRQVSLPFIPAAATHLTFGYEPDLAFSSILRVLVACSLGSSVLWCAQVNEEEFWRGLVGRHHATALAGNGAV